MAGLFDFGGCLHASLPAEVEREPDSRALEADWEAIGEDMLAAHSAYQKGVKHEKA